MNRPKRMSGITWIVAATLVLSAIMSLLFGTFLNRPIVIAGIVVGLQPRRPPTDDGCREEEHTPQGRTCALRPNSHRARDGAAVNGDSSVIAHLRESLLNDCASCMARRHRPAIGLWPPSVPWFDGPIRNGLVELERLTLVVLYDEPVRHDQMALRLAGYSGTEVPWGVMWGGAEQNRFFKDLSLQPLPQGRGLRLDLVRPRLLRIGLQLARLGPLRPTPLAAPALELASAVSLGCLLARARGQPQRRRAGIGNPCPARAKKHCGSLLGRPPPTLRIDPSSARLGQSSRISQ